MSAVTDPTPDQASVPRTWRPRGVRRAGFVLSAMVVIVAGWVWIAWGPEVRTQFTFSQRLTLLLLGGTAFAALYALMRSRVTAATTGVTVVNGYRRHEYAWSQLVGIVLPNGAPWASLDLSDGTSVGTLGIQGSDGAHARRAVADLRGLIAAHTPVSEDPAAGSEEA